MKTLNQQILTAPINTVTITLKEYKEIESQLKAYELLKSKKTILFVKITELNISYMYEIVGKTNKDIDELIEKIYKSIEEINKEKEFVNNKILELNKSILSYNKVCSSIFISFYRKIWGRTFNIK